ncbi:MAG TPA: protein TolR [Xanthomonadaceae bacterium]|jgi:biopolymer transport protein TolR|nr:protein TolR [Xanthomonadaceae bacterium]
MTRQRKRRKLKADINVVPYIDVMLVLLIIFMVTAPLLNLGVDVDLPKSKAHTLDQKKDPVVVKIARDGSYKLKLADAAEQKIGVGELSAKIAAFHDQNPNAAVYIAADGALDYQKVMDLMTLLQTAGIPRVALMSQPAHADAAKPGNR